MKPSSQQQLQIPKILVSLRKDIENKAKRVALQIKKKIRNPHFKYSMHFWSLYLKEDIVDSEKATEKTN